MSGEDFIKLPNGQKIYIKDAYGKIEKDDFKSKKMKILVDIFDKENYDGKLKSSEIGSLFSSLKACAEQDGNNELSSAELMGFIKQNIPKDIVKYIKPKDMMKFLETVQEKSDKVLNNTKFSDIHIENTFNKIFPELSFLNLGMDNNIDRNKLNFNEIKKHYPEDKYEVIKKEEKQYVAEFPDGRTSVSNHEPEFDDPYYADVQKKYTRTRTIYSIINRENGKEVVTASGFNGTIDSFRIQSKTDDKYYRITKFNENLITISTVSDSDHRSIDIRNGKIADAQDNDKYYTFSNGILEELRTNNEIISYNNGIQDKIETLGVNQQEKEYIATNLVEILTQNSIDSKQLIEIIDKSVNSNNIGTDMDDYYALTGRELTDDIKNSKLSDNIKKDLLNKICEPYIDSKYYDANKVIENSKVDNPPYYTSSDEYKVSYNGPIITVFNKTSGETTRINLKTLMKDMVYSRKSWLGKSLKTIQSYSGEILENMNIELAQIKTMTYDERNDGLSKMNAAAFYEHDVIHTPRLDRHKGSIIVHEMAHGIDDVSGTETPGFTSARGKFKEVYDKCIAKYEASGHKRFDDMHPMRSIPILPINKGVNYATYNEQEAFAICMEIIFGYSDSNTKFVKNYMPELIDAARDLYLEIRKIKREERRVQ